jgi:large subunit ribosomal protein L19
MGGQIENDDWPAKAVALMAETTADEVPAEDEPKAEKAEGEADAKAEKSDKAEK